MEQEPSKEFDANTATNKECLQVLMNGVLVGQKNGLFSLKDASVLYNAYDKLLKHFKSD